MDDIIKRFCPRYDFDSYEDMKQNFKINVPDDFNFGFDVVDAWADIEPEKLALVWTNDAGDMARYTFKGYNLPARPGNKERRHSYARPEAAPRGLVYYNRAA